MIRYVQGTIPGMAGEQPIAVVRGDVYLSQWIENARRLDADDQVLLRKIMELIPEGSVVVDAGASLGDHAALYATKAAVVHAFEPQPEVFTCLAWNCCRSRVWPHMVGLSDYDGVAMISHNPANIGASPISANGDTPIQLTRLDRFNLSPALIKLDVEGHEVPALFGARQTILRSRPVLVVEVNKWQLEAQGSSIHDLWEELASLGYSHCTDIRTGQPFDPDDGRPEYDIVGEPD